ncbi:MAG: aspartate kinase [Saprospiraceae bacterium]|nr:aspartate kinase [Saprospiraceae bacterium]
MGKFSRLSYQVYKFGGSSVADASGFLNVKKISQDQNSGPLLIVLSALGKTTNDMEEVADSLISAGEASALEKLEVVENKHIEIANELGISETVVSSVFESLKDSLKTLGQYDYDKAYDQLVCFGELCSTRILFELLSQNSDDVKWIDARKIIMTNDIHRDATVNWVVTRENILKHVKPLLDEGKIVVTQGFIGGYDDWTTTLGREGSDYSAAIFAYCLDASELTIWKDVEGILTGDPRAFENVIKMDRLSYKEAIEMTYYGAKVIHPKTIKPLENKGIILHVRSFKSPDMHGTIIKHDVEVAYPPIVVIDRNQALLHISTQDFSFVAEHHMSLIFNLISNYRIKINMMRNTAISFTVCVTDVKERLDELIQALSREFEVFIDRDMELVTIRHYDNADVKSIIGSRPIIFEERIKDTLQMVVRAGEGLKRKD